LDQDVARFPRQFRDGAGQDDAPDRRIPVGGRVEGHLRGPEAVALQDKGAVPERLSGRDCGLDVAPDLEKIVGVDVLVVLPCADRQRRKAARREGAGGRPQLQRSEIAAAAVHLNEQRRRRRRCQRLPQRGGDPEPVDCADRQKPQPDAWQRLHVVWQPFRPRHLLVGNAGRDMCLAHRSSWKGGYDERSITRHCGTVR
jgi:hypothetical protein